MGYHRKFQSKQKARKQFQRTAGSRSKNYPHGQSRGGTFF